MSRINRVPRGFQAFLGNTNFGDNPSELAPEVRATVDISEFYAPDAFNVGSSGNNVVNASGSVVTWDVPPGEIWFLWGGGFAVSQQSGSIGDEIVLQLQVTGMPLGSTAAVVPIYLGGAKASRPALGGSPGFESFTLPRLFPVASGSVIECVAGSLSAGSSWNVRPQYFYFPLRA